MPRLVAVPSRLFLVSRHLYPVSHDLSPILLSQSPDSYPLTQCPLFCGYIHPLCPVVERCKHVKSQATTVYFRLGKLRRVTKYVQQMWGIIGHVTVEAGNTVGTDGAPPQVPP